MDPLWQEELSRFSNMRQPERILWLSRLLFFLSMFARDTYQAGATHVDKPDDLRRYNETIHRISSFLLEMLTDGDNKGWPDDQFFILLSTAVEELDMNPLSLLEAIKKLETVKKRE